MDLKLYNTLTHRKEVFKPLDPKNVRMYVCGPTVYDYAHIGNARPAIVFDVLFRLLRHLYGEQHVTYVRNITDVDDKIIAAAKEEGVSIDTITERTAKAYHEDVAALGCLPPTAEPRATDHIKSMIAMIEKLVAAGHAYVAEGHVLYDVTSKSDYGKLAHRSTDEMIAGARVEVAPYKKHPMDFVLWKPSPTPEAKSKETSDQPGWESPWGRGRPGWHIECSAMGEAFLGETFDIHGGGIDLVFPHHENEIAQSEGAHHGAPLARYWLHNGFLEVEGAKMSKSLGNFVTIRELLDRLSGEVIRLQILMTHYRQPMDWTEMRTQEAKAILEGWSRAVRAHFPSRFSFLSQPTDFLLLALSDDLNMPTALSDLHKLSKEANEGNEDAARQLGECLTFLGLNEYLWVLDVRDDTKRAMIESMISARNDARKAKNFAEADRLRKELEEEMGVLLMDTSEGTKWELKR